VTVLGESDDGSDAGEHVSVPGSAPDAPVLELDAEIGFGHLHIRRG
jgi:hypothetical protein